MPSTTNNRSAALNWIITGVVLIGGLVYLAYSRRNTVPASANSTSSAILDAASVVGRTAPGWTLEDVNGKPVSLSQFKGHPVVMDFWATWCGPCQIEIPWFVQFQNEYGSKGLAIVGVSMDEDGWKAINPFVHKRHINYTILLGNDSVATLYGGLDALPTTYILDRQGRIAYPPHIGLVAKSEYLDEIQTLLGKKDQSSASLFHLLPNFAAALAGAK